MDSSKMWQHKKFHNILRDWACPDQRLSRSESFTVQSITEVCTVSQWSPQLFRARSGKNVEHSLIWLHSVQCNGEMDRGLSLHCVLVAAITVKAPKWKNFFLLAQFSTKLNQSFITFWEYLDTKISIIYTNNFVSQKMRKMLSSFQKESQQTSENLEISQK